MKNKLTLLLTLLFVAILFTKCSSDAEFNEKESNDGKKIDKIIITVDKLTIENSNISKSSKKWINQLYAKLRNQSIWIKNGKLSDSIQDFFNYLNSDIALNIPIGYFSNQPFTETENIVNKEIRSLLRSAEYLFLKDTTIINYSKNTLNKLELVSQEYFIQFLKDKKPSDSWIEHLVKYKEKNQRLIQLHYALNHFTAAYGIENKINNKIYLKTPKDSLASVFIAKQLYNRNFISDTLMNTISLKEKLRSFQLLNGLNTDAKLGKKTMDALNETNYERYIKGVISLDKMRDFPDSLIRGKLIEINIPSYLLRLYIDDEILNTSKVIIGTKRNQTPLFTSTMKYIVVRPYWNVPYSIASKEILPKLKKDVSYLKKNRYSILDRDRNQLLADSIDWNKYSSRNFPFFIRQEPGPKNSLGLVKLMFPNDKSIYVHDTPSKYLFARDERTFSHGCVRAESPFKLVHEILSSENHIYIDSVEFLIERAKETYLMLSKTFPVTIIYNTSGINDSTHLVQFFKDVYNKEGSLYELFSKPSEEI